MALRAVLAKLIVMRVFVAVGAAFKRYACKLLKILPITDGLFMTFYASNFCMLPF